MSETKSSSERSFIPLRYQDKGDVHVEAPRGDRFVVSVAEAVNSCVLNDSMKSQRAELTDQVHKVLDRVASWASEKPRVVRAFTAPGTDGSQLLFQFVLVVDTDRYPFDLAEEAAELEVELYKKWPRVGVRIFIILSSRGPDAIADYLDSENAVQFHGEPPSREG